GDGLLAYDETGVIPHQAQEREGVRLVELDLHRVAVEGPHFLDVGHFAAPRRADGRVSHALKGEDDVLGREFAVAMVPLHAPAQVEGQDAPVLADRPALGQVRLDALDVDGAGGQVHQAVEDRLDDRV